MMEYRDELWERVSAYAENELDAEERAAFEECLQDDPALREALQSWREVMRGAKKWYETPSPGADRLDKLTIPAMRGAGRRFVWWKRLAAAALFVMGFGLGVLAQRDMGLLDAAAPTLESPATVEQRTTGNEPVSTKAKERATPRMHPEETNLAQLDEPTYTQQEDGRLIIETTLRGSGARAVWIVDGGFRLPGTGDAR